ncbi:elongator complex protein 1 [Pyricularia oryzae 70-15]|uniref:Elongator complex protein 1 n=3 Tax=Pyricularia oryzae TaxID=318829 RepID=G4MTL1_PYRO7|nr:elongator complex protein 1 [Pyricularia oryzae 70-15]EHA55569.1 elongator complex protein 1 [Pyricularia oryzae 70-15]ELQ37121.1 elongator complex protein 1 [Pyricularia oryzae Y34]KAI7914086.1 elongator complex protein 1 [Pyricularia oryzae]KAI7922294.1 elongator complex protein 1 [Pyricularia oryzae]
MRNLRNIRYDVCKTDVDVTATCWDAGSDDILVTFGPTEADPSITLARISDEPGSSRLKCVTVASWEAPSPHPDIPFDQVVSLHHFSDNATTCLVLAGGDVVTVQEDQHATAPGTAHIEIAGSIDAGIAAARWAYDDELLVLATKVDTVIFMSRSFDAIAEVTMTVDDLQASKHVSVGWGKKETQFQGKGAKALRDPTIPEKVDRGLPSALEDSSTTISWREDGAYVAINSVRAGSRRVIRVYTREGVLDSASEPVDCLEGSMSWRPSGNLIAGIQRLSDRVDVVFFERNGLRHGQFTLRFPPDLLSTNIPINLEWNPDSTVLAVSFGGTVQLWAMGNYHWYLKQEIRCASTCFRPSWHPEKPMRLSLVCKNSVAHTEWVFHTSRGSILPPHDYGAVAVIDGNNIKITPFRTATIPPPMAMFELEAATCVIDVAFTPNNSHMAVLHRTGVDIYEWQTKAGRVLCPKRTINVPLKAAGPHDTTSPLQVAMSSPEDLALLSVKSNKPFASIYKLASGKPELLCELDAQGFSGFVFSATAPILPCVQDRSGKLLQPSAEGQALLPVKFSTQLPWAEVILHDDSTLAVGMSRGGQLYANTRLLAKNCTSFVVTGDHLIFTTTNHFLKLVHLTGVEELEVPADDPEVDERCRSIERGARLVTAVPSNMNVVLQMPRGNLETIFPRAMVVAGIRKLINDKNYARAFSYCRTQRVDMNILYDHRPEQFLANVGLFLDQLGDTSYIDLVLSSLREEDVTQTMYKDTKKSKPAWAPSSTPLPSQENPPSVSLSDPSSSKVNTVCDAVLKELEARNPASLQNIITAHVCKNPPALDDGLSVIAGLMKENEALAEKAVEHICFLVDVNRLYDNALGLYNLELALLVAQQSQRDPREYLPFVQSLHQLSQLRRCFTIDDHLGNREKALGHLKADSDFEGVKDYAVKHSLYQDALGLYRYEAEQSRTLMALYAEYLESNSRNREAGLAYEALGKFAEAMSCYRAAGPSSWRECLAAAQKQQPPPTKSSLTELAESLADALNEAKDYVGAATIQRDFLNDPATAIQLLCKGSLFADAMLLAATSSEAGLDGEVDSGLTEAFASSTELLADCKAQLKAQTPRILDLRRKAAEDPLGFYEGERPGGGDGDMPDDVSVAASSRLSTSASLFTRYTGKEGSIGTAGTGVSRATHKNRKREEKKRARGRKGTVYEEEYLVNSTRRLIERVNSVGGETEALVAGLFRRGMLEQARAVEALLAEVVEGCRLAVQQVWPGSEAKTADGQQSGQAATGGDAVLEAAMEARVAKQEPPMLPTFQRLSLLG